MSELCLVEIPNTEGRTIAGTIAQARRQLGEWVVPLLPGKTSAGTAHLLDHAGMSALRRIKVPITEALDAEGLALDLGAAAGSGPGEGAVIALDNEAFAWPAAIFAAACKRSFRLVDDLQQAIRQTKRDGARSLTLFAPPSEFTPSRLDLLHDSTDTPHIPFGIVTGRDDDEVWSWLLRRMFATQLYREHQGIAVYGSDSEVGFFDSEAGFHSESDADSQTLEELTEAQRDSVILKFHTKESCGFFGRGIICGLPDREPRFEAGASSAAPGCVSGKRCLWGSQARLPFQQIDAAHLLSLSCSSLRLGAHLTDLNYSLGLNAFAGRVRSYISPTRFVFVDKLVTYFAYRLYRSGESLGSIASYLNAFVKFTSSDFPCFALLGDPEDRPRLEACEGESIASQLEFKALCKTMRDSPGNHFSLADVRLEQDANWERRAQSQPEQHEPVTQPYDTILNNLRMFDQFNFFIGGLKEIPHEVHRDKQADERLLLKLFEQLVSQWAMMDAQKSFWLSNFYTTNEPFHLISRSGACPYCGETVNQHKVGDLQAGWSRLIHICPRCGIIADVPTTEITYRLDAPERVTPGQSFVIDLELNGLEETHIVGCAVSLNHSLAFGWKEFPQTWVERTYQKRALTWRKSVTIPESFPAMVYHLRAFLLLDGVPWFLSRPLIVMNQRH